jgi:cellulose synthase/poly-beta-1,6-N-acetylglucosamine synthase-like glycosyltransferase
MFQLWEVFFEFWASVPFERLVSLFWYFFIIEIPRYLLFDVVVVILFVTGKRWRANGNKSARSKVWIENPLLSIVVPGKNEGSHIEKLVKSLKEQTYQNFELIVVDDGSTDNTPLICRELERKGDIDLFLRNDVRGGKASAANLGLRYSNGQFIIHLDADSSFDSNALENIIIPFYARKNVGAVGGNVKVRNYKESLIASFQAAEYLQTLTMGRMVASFLGIYRVVSGAFGAFRKDLLDNAGGWDIGPGLDGDITQKIRKMGYRVVFEPAAVCLTNVPTTLKAFSKQRFRWSRSIVRFRLRKHADIFRPDQNFKFRNFISSVENIFYNIFLDGLWFYYIIRLIIRNPDILLYMFMMKMILYGISNMIQIILACIVSERGKKEIRYLLYVPFISLYDGYYLRIIRTIGYLREWFVYSSYDDDWNPKKTSVLARKHGL